MAHHKQRWEAQGHRADHLPLAGSISLYITHIRYISRRTASRGSRAHIDDMVTVAPQDACQSRPARGNEMQFKLRPAARLASTRPEGSVPHSVRVQPKYLSQLPSGPLSSSRNRGGGALAFFARCGRLRAGRPRTRVEERDRSQGS
jgi:hypothetical protein